ncbi:2-hydroxyacid dehydrogenase [Ruicaihuangia caeni]|uniref:2-hydroxyacid dehydrogenase n=1 Tax=Ruicaihuangia caeni TaxID=3042517 RepID=UPI00338F6051
MTLADTATPGRRDGGPVGAQRIVFADGDPLAAELLAGELGQRLESLGSFELHAQAPTSNEEFADRIKDADGILLGWHLPLEVLRSAPKLKIVSFTGTGAANFVDLGVAGERGIAVTNTPGYADQTVAEHALALTLATIKQLHTDRAVREGQWETATTSRDLADVTVGVVGLGGIGRRFVELLLALGMRVQCWNRDRPGAPNAPRGAIAVPLEELMATSDVVSLHLGLNEQTRGMIGSDLLGRMRPSSALVNTARAELIDRAALLDALDSGRIASAALDVFHEEPLAADDPLLQHANVLVTPHIGSLTKGATRRVLEIAVENIEAFFAGVPRNLVS